MAARSSRATAWNGTLLVCDSQKVVNTSTPRPAAIADSFAHQTALADARRSHHADHSAVAIDCAVQQAVDGGHLPPPTDQSRLGDARHARAIVPMPSSRRAGTGSSAPLMCTNSGSARAAVPQPVARWTALSITPPGGATDSIRCAIPTCSPIAV